MLRKLHLLIVVFTLAGFPDLPAQVELKLALGPDGDTYTVSARSQAEWAGAPENVVHQAEITLVVPAGGLAVINLQSHVGDWELTHLIEQPVERPGADYIVFRTLNAITGTGWLQGQEVPLFSFENTAACPGAFELMDHSTDPFTYPNSLNMPVGQAFFVEGAGGDAYLGNYDTGMANCMNANNSPFKYRLKVLPDKNYQLSLLTDTMIAPDAAIQSLRVVVKVPTNNFRIHHLSNLQTGTLAFAGVSRYDAPAEEPDYDYIQFNLAASQAFTPQPGGEMPLLQFGNAGSCQGDSVFLVQPGQDPFLPPNSLGVDIGPLVRLEGVADPQAAGIEGSGSAACAECLYNDEIITVDPVITADPVVCLGGYNGMIEFHAYGANALEYSLDGGLTWSAEEKFYGLHVGIYEPRIRGDYFGCTALKVVPPVELDTGTVFSLQIDVPDKVCEGDDMALQIISPGPLPLNTIYQWTGPLGFSSGAPDPAIFDVHPLQSGTYTLAVEVPGCDPTSQSATVEVNESIETPVILSNAPVCRGEALEFSTDVTAAKYEWIGPAGQGTATLSQPGMTTTQAATSIDATHPAYVSGNWRVRLTDGNGCIAESEAVSAVIKNRPQAFAVNDGPVCLGGDIKLSSNPVPGAIYRWRKLGDTVVFSMQPEPLIQQVYSQQSFELEVEVDGCKSQNTAITTATLHPKPSAFPLSDYEAAPDCAPRDLQLNANASGVIVEYDWSGVNGFSSQLENPVIPSATTAHNGSYQLLVTNIHGCTAMSPFQVSGVVDPVATPVIQSTGAVCPGEDITLNVAPYNGVQVSYQWFRNGSEIYGATSSQLNLNAVQHSDEGMYRLEVHAGDCKVESGGLQVNVLDPPQANPNFILVHPCEGSTLQFFSNTNGIAAWEWSGPNGFTSNAANPLIYNTEFNDIGAYSLTVTGNNGCSVTETTVVDGILQVPGAPDIATNSPVCPEDEIIMVVQNPVTTGTVSYDWYNGVGDPVGDNGPTLVMATDDPDAIGPFLAKTVVNGCESVLSDPIAITVRPLPVADAGNSGVACPGEQVQLFAAPVADATYSWQIAGQTQAFSFEQNPSFTAMDTTLVELTVKLTGCDAEATDQTTIFTNKKPVVTGLTGGGSHCEGAEVLLSGQNGEDMDGDITYTWTGPGGFNFIGTAEAGELLEVTIDVLQPQNEGTYTLQLKSSEGCDSDPKSLAVDYVTMPPPPVIGVSATTLCQDETLQLDVSPFSGSEVEYQWYFNDGTTDFLLGVTDYPTYFLNSVMPSNTGTYFAMVNVDGCQPPPSNLVAVEVLGLGTSLSAGNSTDTSTPACEGEAVQLEADLIPGAVYNWYGPAGFQATTNNPLISPVNTGQAGDYLVTVGLPGCNTTLSAATTVYINPVPETPVLAGATTICAGTDATISVANPQPDAIYSLYSSSDLMLVETDSMAFFTFEAVSTTQAGNYFVIAGMNDCHSDASSLFELQVQEPQTAIAYAGDGQVVCKTGTPVVISGNQPVSGYGYWSSPDQATVMDPLGNTTAVSGLQQGENRFIWNLEDPVCQVYSSDTIIVLVENLEARADFFEVDDTGSGQVLDLLANDKVEDVVTWDASIFSPPAKGEVRMDTDGLLTYEAYPHVFGGDELVYELCSMNCPDICDTARVSIAFTHANGNATDCFVPNLFTPNNDGENEHFIVPCAAAYPGTSLVVFNRWGTKVYETGNYQNDWAGTYDGKLLPAGTYFYQLVLNDGHHSTLQGYVVVMR